MHETKRPLKVFLCHASTDKPKVRELYRYLKRRGIQPWFDEEHLVGGQDWQVEIPKALATSDAIIICLTKNSVDKEGYIQKEIKFALDKALEMPEGRIFLIPVKFEECEVPFTLSRYQWVDLTIEAGYSKMMKALKFRASQLERSTIELSKKSVEEEIAEREVAEKVAREKAEKDAAEKEQLDAEEQARQKAAKEKAEREAAEKVAREKVEKEKANREAAEKAKQEKTERQATREKVEREAAERIAREKTRKEKEERERSSRNRILEAAIEKQVSVGVSTSLFVWIKRLESKSIISVVSSIDEDVVLDEDNVKSKGLEIEFPIKNGRVQPAGISLRLVAHEFTPSIQQKKIIVSPEGDSEVCTFIVTPNKAGRLLLNLEVLKDQVSLVTRTLHTTAIESEKKVPSSMVLVSIPIIVFVQPKSDGISVGGDISGNVVVSGSGNVINVGKQTEDNSAIPKPRYEKAKKTFKTNPTVVAALITAVATVIVAIFSSPISSVLFNKATPTPIMSISTKHPTPTKTLVPTATKTKVPTVTPTLTPTPVPQSSILFQDNFDDGNANGWDPSQGTWIVKKDETGNYIYEGTGPDNYPQTWPGSKDWTDYAFESRIKIKKGTVFVLVRGNGSYFYNVSINTSDISLARWNSSKSEYKVVKSLSYPIQLNKWYLVRVEIVGQQYKLYIDNKLLTSYTYESDSPVIKGGVGYYIGGGETVQIDDVRVWSLK